MWREKPDLDCTWNNFVPHFERGEKEQLRLITASSTAGYHDANVATTMPDNVLACAMANAAITPSVSGTVFQYNTVALYYCWTHGLSKNRSHVSSTCTNKDKGHKDDATLDRRKGGSCCIMFGDHGPGNRRNAYNSNNG